MLKKIMIATPHKYDTTAEYAQSLACMLPNVQAEYSVQLFECSLLSDGRSDTFMRARREGWDYLMFIDSDMHFPSDGLKKLLALKRDIASGVYFQRAFPHRPNVFNFTPLGQVRNLGIVPDRTFRCEASGAGFLLIGKKVLQAYTDEILLEHGHPFHHISVPSQVGGGQLGEDVSFFYRMKRMGFEVWCDPSIRIGHVSHQVIYGEHYLQYLQQCLDKDKCHDGEPDGWMTKVELDWLASTAEKMDSVLEVGSWKGRSTKRLLEGCKGSVFAVDHFKGSDDSADLTMTIASCEPIYDIFMSNVGSYPNLKIMRMSSDAAAGMTPDKSVDMVFIDSDHRYQNVKKEIEQWLPKAKKMICGHDYADGWEGVKQAVNEAFGKKIKTEGSIWYVEL